MTLTEARNHLGRTVAYSPPHGGPPEHGVITGVSDQFVFVVYDTEHHPKATAAEHLELA